jgi:hypothetical protein
MRSEINKVWKERGLPELTVGKWRFYIKGHDVWWLADLFLDCYSVKGFDSYKCWNIIKTHRVKQIRKPRQSKLI